MGAPQLMHTVIAKECTGCKLCLPPCPVNCITMVATGDAWTHEQRKLRAGQYRRRHAARLSRLEHERLESLEKDRGENAERRKQAAIERAMQRARRRLQDRKREA